MFGSHFPRRLVFIMGVIGCALVAHNAGAAEPLTLERIFGKKPMLTPLPDAAWVGDSKGISLVHDVTPKDGSARKAFVIRDVPSGQEHVLAYLDDIPVPDDLKASGNDKFTIDSPSWANNGSRAAFVFGGDIFMVDRKGKIERVTDTKGEEQDPTFSRDGHWLAYTRGHDLYTRDLERGVEIRHTSTGCDTVYNGILNWVYMEELFTRGEMRSFWWSPTGARLAFLEIRDGVVPEYPIVDQVAVPATWKMQRYPKPGDPNPRVRVGVIDVASQAVLWTDVETGPDNYIVRVNWLGDGRSLAIEKMNRNQDHLTLLFADASTGKSDVVLEESSPTWINDTYAKYFYEKKRQFLWSSEKDGHMHLYLYNLDGSPIRQLTRGNWEVLDLAGVDEKKGRIYFTANEGSVLEQHLYRVDEDGKNLKRITTEEGTHDVVMSPDHKYYLEKYSSATRPTRSSVCTADGKRLFDIGDQATGAFASLELPAPQYGTIQHEGDTFHYRIIKPLDFDPAKKYPVIVYVYGGPHAQMVKKNWTRSDLYLRYLNEQGYLVFSLDGRGSFGRGKAWEEPLLKRMGKIELDDQVAGVDYLKTLPYVDADRIGIWGWSYGGYMTLEALFNRGDVFKAGVAVAPVTDWRLYDSIYTERYMKLPKDNADGYTASAPLANIDGYKGRLLLMHGDADDNVHMQNAVSLVRKLIDAGKDFDYMVYPQKEHGITGSADRLFLYRKMSEFFDRNLEGRRRYCAGRHAVKTDVFRRRVTEDPADPGFGAKVSAASGQRLLNRDGTFNARRRGVRSTQAWSPYHDLLNMSWGRFALAMVGSFVGLNVLFALAYVLCGPGAISGPNADTFGSRLLESFFLSAQTLSTVGYGHLAPASTTANFIAVVEMFFGFLMYAIAAGLAFARFSRPMAKLVFSDHAVIAPHRDVTALMFRFANVRKNQLVELQVKVLFSMIDGAGESPVRRYHQLELERERVAFIPLHLTVVHVITDQSPLFGLSKEALSRGAAELLVLVTAMDETFSQTVHARTSYTHAEIEFGSRFATVLSLADDGVVEVDLRRFHDIEQIDSAN